MQGQQHLPNVALDVVGEEVIRHHPLPGRVELVGQSLDLGVIPSQKSGREMCTLEAIHDGIKNLLFGPSMRKDVVLQELHRFLTTCHHDRLRRMADEISRRSQRLDVRKHLSMLQVHSVHHRCHVIRLLLSPDDDHRKTSSRNSLATKVIQGDR